MRRTPFVSLILLALVLLAAAPASLAENGALDRIVKAGTIRIAVPDNFPPFGTLGADAKLQGYDIETATLIAAALGVKPDLVPVASPDRIAALTGGKVDLVVSSLGKSAERERQIAFSTAYAPFYSAVFGPAGLAVGKPGDLVGKSVAVTRGTLEETALAQVAPTGATIKRFDDNDGTETAFLFSQTELIATGNTVAAEVFAKSPLKKTAIKFVLRNSPCYVGVAKGEPALLARVNDILAAARNDGSLDKISQHWLKA